MRRPPAGQVVVALTAAAALAAAVALAGCGATGQPGQPDRAAGEVAGEVTVLAAASLTEAFTELGRRFERSHPEVTVRFSFAASSELASQVTGGAPADVFASASTATMDQVVRAGATDRAPVVFARNSLQIAVPAGNPGRVTGLADLARADLTVALCAPDVPCGQAAARAVRAAGVTPAVDTLEQDVKAALTKVVLGEVDAALIYRTDVLAAGPDVVGIDFPEAADAVTDYPIVLLADAPNPVAAQAFVDLVVSPAGAAVLTRDGFGRP